MKKILIPFLFIFMIPFFALSNGVCIVDASAGSYFTLVSSQVYVQINNQIAVIKTTQVFRNDTGENTMFKYGFPMPESGSATSLRWLNGQFWFEADFTPVPQDTIIPGGGSGNPSAGEQLIRDYLGETPLYFEPYQVINDGAYVTLELTYVQLLPYEFNRVSFFYPNDYTALQSDPVSTQEFNLTLDSEREIVFVDLFSPQGADINNSGHTATANLVLTDEAASENYYLEYELNADELGLFNFSTFLPQGAVQCDTFGKGYLAFIVEPDPSDNTAVIGKEFTLIIDKSGSMTGQKIVEAREAAKFIIEHLNPGDYFNLVAFSSTANSFQPDHVPYNPSNEAAALNFISALSAGGGTDIEGAFSETIPQFQNTDPDIAKIIIFFTDGNGNTSTQSILDHVSSLLTIYNVEDLNIFTFGIGPDVNTQLLSQLATQNDGLVEFLQNDQLQEVISDFYLTIQNPVLLNTQMTFVPPIITEAYPQPLPNLFKGQQLIVVGRYEQPEEVTVIFSGTAFGNQVEYQYTFDLADTSLQQNQFLPRLWAKKKMEHLNSEYYNYSSSSAEAMALEDEIVDISLCYGVLSAFTSFGLVNGGSGGSSTDSNLVAVEYEDLELETEQISAMPNPFAESVMLRFQIQEVIGEYLWIEIYDSNGRLVRILRHFFGTDKIHEVFWDGKNESGIPAAPGIYQVKMKCRSKTYIGRVVKF